MVRHKKYGARPYFVLLTRRAFSHRVMALDGNGSIPRGPNGYPSIRNFLPDPQIKREEERIISEETVVIEEPVKTEEPRTTGETPAQKMKKNNHY